MNREKEQKILKEARERLKKAMGEDEENRRMALSDLEFVAVEGAQWPAEVKAQRLADERPCLTINKMPAYIDQVVGDQRMNRPSIKVIPVDSDADPKIATLLGGWIKHVQKVSQADIAVDHGFEHAATCGYGAMRVVTRYSSDSAFEQDAFIEQVDNALAVFWGPHSKYDCSDAMYCFLVSDLDREEFKEKYKEDPMPFDSANSQYVEGWGTKDKVRLAEYFVKEPVTKTIYLLADGKVVDKVEENDRVLKERKVNTYKVMWYLLSGNRVLEEREWVGKKYIPVIPIWGKEFNVGGKRIIRGLIRNAKDPQRMYNFWQALSLDTLIPVANGWTTIGQVQIGNKIFDDQGKLCTVTNVSPIFENRDCVEILFDDNSTIIADVKHLWTVEERGNRQSTTFGWTKKTITSDELVPGKHFIWCQKPLELPEQNLLIPPYVLGVWLGDGTSAEPVITQSAQDTPELCAHLERFGCVLNVRETDNKPGSCAIAMLGIRDKFTALDLLHNKHIPYHYVRGSAQQRLELLQGLMDTDGSIGTSSGSCDFTTTNENLAKGFAELLRSLGIKAKFLRRDRADRHICGSMKASPAKRIYQFSFTTRLPVFRLSRKLKKIGQKVAESRRTDRYGIKSVTPVLSVPVKCLTVDSPSELFLAGPGMVPTHNSCDTEQVALAPKAPYLATPHQIAGHEDQWKEAHRKNFPYLLVNFDQKSPGWPKREAPPQASTAMVEKLRETDQEIRDTIGLQKASMGMQSNERSGVAIRERKMEGDVGTFAFIDNLSRSIEYLGRVLIDIAPGILDTERIVRLGLDNGEYKFDAVNVTAPDGKVLNDLSLGTYDVTVTVGPSFTTQRTEARQSMAEFLQYYPAAAPLIGDLYAKAMDWPGAEEVSQRLQFLLPPEIKAKIAAEEAEKAGGAELPPSAPPAPPNGEQQAQEQMQQTPSPLDVLRVKQEELKLKESEVRLAQEEAKLEGLRLQNQLIVAQGADNIRKIVNDVVSKEMEGAEDANRIEGGEGLPSVEEQR